MYIYIYVYVSVYAHVCMYVYEIKLYICVCACMHVCKYVCMHVYVNMYTVYIYYVYVHGGQKNICVYHTSIVIQKQICTDCKIIKYTTVLEARDTPVQCS